jgi:hypothetical protein
MKVTLDLTDEQWQFIKETGHELQTQDNRHTATPIFRIYEEIKVEKRDGCGEHLERLEYEGAEENYCGHCRSILNANDGDLEKLPPIGESDCYCDAEPDAHWTYDIELLPSQSSYDGVAFLTEKAAQQYLEANHYHFTKGVVYAESAFRNWELKGIIDVLKTMSEQR